MTPCGSPSCKKRVKGEVGREKPPSQASLGARPTAAPTAPPAAAFGVEQREVSLRLPVASPAAAFTAHRRALLSRAHGRRRQVCVVENEVHGS